jgi:hypothetical protein
LRPNPTASLVLIQRFPLSLCWDIAVPSREFILETRFELLLFLERANVFVSGDTMNIDSHILVNRTQEQLRRLGARGAKGQCLQLARPVVAPNHAAGTATADSSASGNYNGSYCEA